MSPGETKDPSNNISPFLCFMDTNDTECMYVFLELICFVMGIPYTLHLINLITKYLTMNVFIEHWRLFLLTASVKIVGFFVSWRDGNVNKMPVRVASLDENLASEKRCCMMYVSLLRFLVYLWDSFLIEYKCYYNRISISLSLYY